LDGGTNLIILQISSSDGLFKLSGQSNATALAFASERSIEMSTVEKVRSIDKRLISAVLEPLLENDVDNEDDEDDDDEDDDDEDDDVEDIPATFP